MRRQARKHGGCECRQLLKGRRRRARDRRDEPDERAVSASEARRVEHEPRLVRVPVCHDPSASLVPVEDRLPLTGFLDQITVDGDLRASQVKRDAFCRHGLPAGPRKTVLRGVNRVSLTLAGVIPSVKSYGRTIAAHVLAIDVVVDAQLRHDVVVERRRVAALPASMVAGSSLNGVRATAISARDAPAVYTPAAAISDDED